MGYERDKDRDTRGVGAIAALDKGNAMRRAQRIAMARRTNALDKALAEYTYRPGGGIGRRTKINLSGLGAINNAVFGKFSGRVGSSLNTSLQPDMPTQPGISSPQLPRGGMTVAPVVDTRPPKIWGGAGTPLQQPPTTLVRGGGVPLTSGGKPVVGVVPPAPTSVAPGSGLSTTVAGSVSGGGGGGGGGATVSQPTFPGFETVDTSELPEDEPSSSGPDLKTLALVGAAGVAAYLLFFRKKRGGTP